MDRRDFVKTICAAGAGGALFLAGAGSAKGDGQTQDPLDACEKDREFSRGWVVKVVESMDKKLDEKEKLRILEECGRECARRGAVKTAVACKGDIEKFLTTMKGWIGETNVLREGKTVRLTYGKCYCPNVRSVEKVPPSYCNCSRGWVKEMFETVLGKSVEVDLLSSIKRGDKECRFVVRT